MEHNLTIPDWNPSLTIHDLDLGAVFAYATSLHRSVGRILKEAGWPVLKLKHRDWDKPFEHDGQQYRYVIKKAASLAADSGDADESDDDLLWLTASSDAVDIEGDIIGLPALKKIKAASVGQTVFLNHNYNVPRDVAGLVKKSRLVRKDVYHPLLDKTATFNCVELGVRPIDFDYNKDGWRACHMTKSGAARMGASVTVLSTAQDDSQKPLIVHTDCISLETSLVGLPANLTAWGHPDSARKSKSMVTVPAALEADPVTPEAIPTNAPPAPTADAPSLTKTADPGASQPKGTTLMEATETQTPVTPAETAVTEPAQANQPAAVPGSELPLARLEQLRKGYFAEAYENRTSNIYWLTCLLCDCLETLDWRVLSPWAEKSYTPEEAEAELVVALDEFKVTVIEKLTAQWLKKQEMLSKGATEALALADPHRRLELNDFLSPLPIVAMTKTILTKAGKRNSAADTTLIQSIHDTTVSLEALCAVQTSAAPLLPTGSAPATATVDIDALQLAHAAEKEQLTKSLSQALTFAEDATAEVENLRGEVTRWKEANNKAMALLRELEQQPLT
jgi:hypothetical protein